MAGSKSKSPSRRVDGDGSPPSYSEADADQVREQRAYISATTTTTVTTTTQTTTFFSLPLWLRRAGPAMAASAMSEGPYASLVHERPTEDGRMARATSCNVDFNKELPDVPRYEDAVDPTFSRRSTGMMHFPNATKVNLSGAKTTRNARSSTLMPPQAQSTRTLAQAGLGIGLPHVMPLAATTAPEASGSSTSRPSTAPRPTRLKPSQEIRRVKSFSRIQSGPSVVDVSNEAHPDTESHKKSTTLTIPHNTPAERRVGGETPPTLPGTRPEPKTLMRRASFWNRRRVQSLKGPSEALMQLEQEARLAPPTLPAFQPVSPMFPERPIQSSPGSSPRSSDARPSSCLRRTHSERSTSSHHSSPRELSFSTDPPPIHARSPHRPSLSTASTSPHAPSLLEPQPRPVQPSFMTSPAISRFPVIDQRQTRPRSMTNPPSVLHRLSIGFFNSPSPSSPISSPTASTNVMNDTPISAFPRHSGTLPRSSLSKSVVEIPKPKANEESPEVFLGRLEEAVSKAEIANILASSGDPYYTRALHLYIDRFDLTNDPLDIALRKLLMDVGLPKETQQIDRVMEAFATRYAKCNPNLFVSQDHPYILAFSLIMLHTDAFNKSNKRKMTKADYIKNTKLVGVSTEVLDYFFDNIIFAPFIFIEDPVDVNGQRDFTQDGRTFSSGSGLSTPTFNGSGLSGRGKSSKVDAYYLIRRNLLDGLRTDVETYIPLRNPFSYQGTAGSWNEAELRRSFARAELVQVDALDARRMSTLPFFSMNVTGAPGPVISNFAPPPLSDQESILLEYSLLKVTKVGLLNRKDDLVDGGKRASNRKWKELWSVVLTGSQLLFYRDSAVALHLIVQSESPGNESFPTQPSFLRPDELLSVKDTIAVYDSSYMKRDYVLRLVMPSGRQILLQTENELQRNEWIAYINYASAFKTAGIRMRPVGAKENARMDRSSYTHDAPQIPSGFSASFSDAIPKEAYAERPTSEPDTSPGGPGLPRSQSPSAELTTNIRSRSRVVLGKIQEFESKIETARTQLESEIRLVHNLAILTPFQRSTRDRLQAAVIKLGRHIRQLRLEIVKATCFRDVLTADLASEDRERKSRRREESDHWSRRFTEDRPRPALSLSIDGDDAMRNMSTMSLSRSDVSELSHGQADSSICESFHSALDFGSDWPRTSRPAGGLQQDISPMRSFERASPMGTPLHEVPPGSPFGSGFFPSSHPAEPSSGGASLSPSVATDRSPVPGQRISDEQAEEWDKTRAARRVSLVRVPANLTTTDRDGRRESFRSVENYSDPPSS